MLRSLIKNVKKLNILQTQLSTYSKCKNALNLQRQNERTFKHYVNSSTAQKLLNETDAEYIVPYKSEKEYKLNVKDIVNVLRTKFRLTAVDMQRIMDNGSISRAHRTGNLGNTLELLSIEGVSKQSFIEHPWLLTLEPVRLKEKIEVLKSMPMRLIDDFVPLLRLSVPRLTKLVRQLNSEATTIPYGNRIYYISEKLQVNPGVITKYLAKRLFILEMPFEMLEKNLQLMIDYKVSPQNLLRDLWAFRYTPKSIELRLQRAKRAKKDKIMPWMVRCTEPILQRSLKLSLDELAVLNGRPTTVEYIADRLRYTVEDTRAILDRHPLTYRVRVTKVKEVLDYLLNEAGFETHEIALVPRILCHGLNTTKARLEELKSVGCRPSSLNIVCLSKREYEKFLQEWINKKKK